MIDRQKLGTVIKYSKLNSYERRVIRENLIKLQEGRCYYCKQPLSQDPPVRVKNKWINWSKFPKGFLRYPVHLHHNHQTDKVLGVVHAYCNAVLWCYENE